MCVCVLAEACVKVTGVGHTAPDPKRQMELGSARNWRSFVAAKRAKASGSKQIHVAFLHTKILSSLFGW